MATEGCYPEKARQLDRLFDTLGSDTRREIVFYFENVVSDPLASLGELTTHLDGRMPHVDASTLRVTLWHQHLPVLESRGWVDVDRRNLTIRYRGNDDAQQLLREVADVFS